MWGFKFHCACKDVMEWKLETRCPVLEDWVKYGAFIRYERPAEEHCKTLPREIKDLNIWMFQVITRSLGVGEDWGDVGQRAQSCSYVGWISLEI